MKKILYAGLSIILLAACQSNRLQKTTKTMANADAALPSTTKVINTQLLESYAGTIPCADCKGIKTELQIYQDNTYVLKETYLGKGDGKAFESTGNLNYERGFGKDNDATMYILDYDKPGQERYFVRFTGNDKQLLMLDKDRKIIRSKLNYTLNKQ